MEFKSMLRQSLPLLILCGIGEIFAGRVFGGMTRFIEQLPGIIVLIPAIMGLKGYIDITLGSRLGSAAHMGLISLDNSAADEKAKSKYKPKESPNKQVDLGQMKNLNRKIKERFQQKLVRQF